jgi:hypothetical protein
VFFALDPALPANRGIIDLDKAPRDSNGRVVFSADLFALVPKEKARDNGVAFRPGDSARRSAGIAAGGACRRGRNVYQPMEIVIMPDTTAATKAGEVKALAANPATAQSSWWVTTSPFITKDDFQRAAD